MISVVVTTVLVSCIGLCSPQNFIEVRIPGGIVRGKNLESRKGRTFHGFMGLRYAKPPVGDLRFSYPVAPEPWTGVYDASKPHGICPQYNIFQMDFSVNGDEDCLFLNVYTPQLPDLNKKLLPVIMYIHGGAFQIGTASSFLHGAEILMDRHIVMVMPNYRLGPLGFLSTGDEIVPGNNGLKDQALALKWIKDNIEYFGGNPERIVVYGHSAGGASSHLHMLSPLTRDLHKGVISQSGVALASWGVTQNDRTKLNSNRLAELLNCSTSSSKEMVDCMRKLHFNDILSQIPKLIEWGAEPLISFPPVVEGDAEGAFLPKDPVDIIKSGEAAEVPFVTGITTEDGAIKSASYHRYPEMIRELNKDFDRVAPITLDYFVKNNDVSKKIRRYYFGDKGIDNNTKTELTDLYTDSFMLFATEETVELHRRYSKQPVYYYIFGYRGSTSHGSYFGHPSTYDYGVCHGDELLYLFNLGIFPNRTLTQQDEEMVEVLGSIYENFATTGNPTPTNPPNKNWKPVSNNEDDGLEYYFIKNPNEIEMVKGLYTDRVRFWRDLGVYSKVTKDIHVEL